MAQPSPAPVGVPGRAGQAIVELVVALFCILLLLSGLLQFAMMATADTQTRADATAQASSEAAGDGLNASFQPIRDWKRGADGFTMTHDDAEVGGSLSRVRMDIAAKTAPGGDWGALSGAIRTTDIHTLSESGLSTTFGFVHARSEQSVETIPAAGALFGLRDPVVGNDVWMVKVGNLY